LTDSPAISNQLPDYQMTQLPIASVATATFSKDFPFPKALRRTVSFGAAR
jgi:hypothetical protein